MSNSKGIKIVGFRPKQQKFEVIPKLPDLPPVKFTIKHQQGELTQINGKDNDCYYQPDKDFRAFRGRVNDGNGIGSLLHLVHHDPQQQAINVQVRQYTVKTHNQRGNILNIIEQQYRQYLNTQPNPNIVLITVEHRGTQAQIRQNLQQYLNPFNKIISPQCLMVVYTNNQFFIFIRNNIQRHLIIDIKCPYEIVQQIRHLMGYQIRYCFKVDEGVAVLHCVGLILNNNKIAINELDNLNTDCYGQKLIKYYHAMIQGNVSLDRIANIRESNKFSR